MRQAEYIWLDGENPTQQVRSKARIVSIKDSESFDSEAYPEWGYDGSSTYQAAGNDSDLILRPVRVVRDPIRGGDARLVLCEVFLPDGTPTARTPGQTFVAFSKPGLRNTTHGLASNRNTRCSMVIVRSVSPPMAMLRKRKARSTAAWVPTGYSDVTLSKRIRRPASMRG
mgnify:CR=1 FL=1